MDSCKIPFVNLYSNGGSLLYNNDVSPLKLISMDCTWSDDGEDKVVLTLQADNISYLHYPAFYFESLLDLCFGYYNGKSSIRIPYIVGDVERRYSYDGTNVKLELRSLSSPLNILSGEGAEGSEYDPENPDETMLQSEQIVKPASSKPIDFICGIMGDSLKLEIQYQGKIIFVYDNTKPGYLPPQFVFDARELHQAMGVLDNILGISSATGRDNVPPYEVRSSSNYYGGPLKDPEATIQEYENSQVNKPITEKDFDSTTPNSLLEFLFTSRSIDVSSKTMMGNIKKLLFFMPEGPWYISQKGNLVSIHDRYGSYVGDGTSRESATRGVPIFNFKSDDNTILDCTIKHNADEQTKDSNEYISQDPTLRSINEVVLHNTSLDTLGELYKKWGLPELKLSAVGPDGSLAVPFTMMLNYDTSWHYMPNGVEGIELAKKLGCLVEGKGQYDLVFSGIVNGAKFLIGGVEVSKEDYLKALEAYQNVVNTYKSAGIHKLYLQEYEKTTVSEIPDKEMSRDDSYWERLVKSNSGFQGGNADYNLGAPSFKVDHRKLYTYRLYDDGTKKKLKWTGMIQFGQVQMTNDALWSSVNKLGEISQNETTGTVVIEGDPSIVDGMVVKLQGIGRDSGNYYVKKVKHSITAKGGYKTTMELCKQSSGRAALILNQVKKLNNDLDKELREKFLISSVFGINACKVSGVLQVGPDGRIYGTGVGHGNPAGSDRSNPDDGTTYCGNNSLTSSETYEDMLNQYGIDKVNSKEVSWETPNSGKDSRQINNK